MAKEPEGYQGENEDILFYEGFGVSSENLIHEGWGIVACPVIQAIGRPDLKDDLRTRSSLKSPCKYLIDSLKFYNH